MPYNATVKSTGEKIKVYPSRNLPDVWYDFDNMGCDKPPAAMRAGKKQFQSSELIIHEKIKG